MTPEQFEQEALERVRQHEGYSAKLYPDPLDPTIITGGYGHNFNEPISPKLADLILTKHDWPIAKNELQKILTMEALNRIPHKKHFALVELMFQLGYARFKGFIKMIQAIEKGDCKEAARELRDSDYYKQVKNRAETLARILES